MPKIKSQGFTLIEVLLVIAILAILASITIMAINPGLQLAKARDSQRLSDVHTILNAIHQYALDNEAAFPEQIDTYALEICRTGSTNCDFLADLSVLTDNQVYLVDMPRDPRCTERVVMPIVQYTALAILLKEQNRAESWFLPKVLRLKTAFLLPVKVR